MKSLILYYSNTGNNQFLAKKMAEFLDADMEAISPRVKSVPLIIAGSLLGVSLGNHKIKSVVEEYDMVVICGPIWMGQLISPLRNAIRHCRSRARSLAFATSCGSSDEDKDGKFGYASILDKAVQTSGGKIKHTVAFPIKLVIPTDQEVSDEQVMSTRLNEENFQGAAQARLDMFIADLRGQKVKAMPS